MERDLKLVLSAVDNTKKTLDDINKRFDSLDKEVKKATKSTENFKSSTDKLKGVAKMLAGIFAVGAIVKFGKASTEAYLKMESAQARLATIVNNATGATREQIQVLFDQAKALERVGVVDATTIMNAQAKLASFDMSTNAIKELTPALLDMAVAEYGLGVTSEQLANLANGLGKAFQGQFDILRKMGFPALTEYQKKVFETGTETERLAMLNEITGGTYGDLNELMAKTTEGSMKNMQMRVNSLKEEIGRGLTVGLQALLGEINNVGGGVNNSGKQFEGFAKVVYVLSQEILALGYAMQLSGIGIKQLGQGVGRGLEQGVRSITTLTKGALTGDFTKALRDVYTTSQETGQKFADSTIKNSEDAGKAFDRLKAKMKEAVNQDGFKMPEFNMFGNKKGQQIVDDVVKMSDNVKKEFDKLGESYKKLQQDGDDALFNLSESHKKNMASIRADMDKTRQEMSKLRASFNEAKASDEQGIASQIVANEQRVAEIQKELAKGVSAEREAELQAELDQRVLATEANAGFIAQFENQIAEVKRRNALTDFERAIEDFNQRRALAESEFQEKMGALQREMRALRDKQRDEKDLYEEKRSFITTQLELVAQAHELNANSAVLTTKNQIEKEIEYYKSLAEAIRASRSGDVSSFNRIKQNFNAVGSVQSVNDAIISPRGDIITTHPDDWLIATKDPRSLGGGSGSVVVNISGNSFMGEEDMAEKVGDKILNILKYNVKLT